MIAEKIRSWICLVDISQHLVEVIGKVFKSRHHPQGQELSSHGALVGGLEAATETVECGLIKCSRTISDDGVRKPLGLAQILELSESAGFAEPITLQSHVIHDNGLQFILSQPVECLFHVETLVDL